MQKDDAFLSLFFQALQTPARQCFRQYESRTMTADAPVAMVSRDFESAHEDAGPYVR